MVFDFSIIVSVYVNFVLLQTRSSEDETTVTSALTLKDRILEVKPSIACLCQPGG